MTNKPTLLSVRDSATLLGVDRDTIYYHIRVGNLQPYQEGEPVLLTQKAVEAFRKQRETYSGDGRPPKQPG